MKWRWLIGSFLVGMLVVLAVQFRKSDSRQESARPVRRMSEAIFAPGRIEGRTSEIELYATVREPVDSILVTEGQRVRQGDILITLDARQYAAEVALAKAASELAEAELEKLKNGARPSEIDELKHICRLRESEWTVAKKRLERHQSLIDGQAISIDQLDQSEAQEAAAKSSYEAACAKLATMVAPPRSEDLAAAQARVASAKARWQAAEATWERTRIYAPCDGQVLQLNAELGEIRDNEPLVVLCDTRKLFVRASVDEFDALRVSVGQKVRVTSNALPGLTLQGRVDRVRPRMSLRELESDRPESRSDTRAREVWVEIEENGSLIIGLPVEIWISDDGSANGKIG